MTSFTLAETYPHPLEKVFGAFATADALARWIAPMDGMPTTVNAFDFAVEGRFNIAFEVGPDVHQLLGQFLVIDAYTDLSFTWVWQPPAPHANVESHVAVSLNAVAAGTALTLTHSRLDAPGMDERHQSGWLNCFTRLHTYLKELQE